MLMCVLLLNCITHAQSLDVKLMNSEVNGQPLNFDANTNTATLGFNGSHQCVLEFQVFIDDGGSEVSLSTVWHPDNDFCNLKWSLQSGPHANNNVRIFDTYSSNLT